jgi:hypothetical protein
VLYAQYADADTTTTQEQLVAALAVTRTRAEAFAAAAKDLASTHATEPAAAQLARAWHHELLRARDAERTALSRKTEYYTPVRTIDDNAGGERSAVKKAARAERAAALAAKAAAEHTAAAAAVAAAATAVADSSGDAASDSESIGADSASSDAPSMRLTAAQRAAVRAAKLASKRHASTAAADAAATAAADASDLVVRHATAAAEAAAAAAKAAATAAAAALQARLLPPLPVARRSIYMHIEGVTGLPKASLATGAVTLKLTWCGRGMGSTVGSATVSESGAAQWPVAQSFLLSLPAEPMNSTVNSSSSNNTSSNGGVMIQQQRPQLKIEVWQGRYCHGTLDLEGDDLLRQCQRISNTVFRATTTTNSSSGAACSSIAKWPHYYPHTVPPATAASPPVSHAITSVAGSVASGGRLLLRAYVLEPGTDIALQAAQEVATTAASRWHGAVNSNNSNSSTDFSSVRDQKVIALATAMTRRWQCPLLYRLQALELVLSDACTATVGQRSVIIVVKRVCRTAASNASAVKAAHINSSTAQQTIKQQQLVTRSTETTAAATHTDESAGAASTALVVHNNDDVLEIDNRSSEELSIVPATAADTAPAATAAVTAAAVATETVTTSTVTEEVGRSQPLKIVPLLSCYTQSFALPAAALLEQLIDGCSEDNASTAGGAVIELHVCQPKRFAAFTAAVAASTKPTARQSADIHGSDSSSSSSDSYSSTELLASVQLSAQQLRDCLGQAATVTLTQAAVTKTAVTKSAVTAASDTPTAVSISTITLVGHVVCAPPPRPRLSLELSQFCEHAGVADTAISDTSGNVSARCTRLTVSWCGAEKSNLLHSSITNKRYVMKSVAAL